METAIGARLRVEDLAALLARPLPAGPLVAAQVEDAEIAELVYEAAPDARRRRSVQETTVFDT